MLQITVWAHLDASWPGLASPNSGKSGKNRENSGSGVWGGLGSYVYFKFSAQKLKGTILLHFGLLFFRFHCGTTWKLCMFMVFGFFPRAHGLQNQLFLKWKHQDTPHTSRKTPNPFLKHNTPGNIKNLEIHVFENGKDGARQIPTIRLTF